MKRAAEISIAIGVLARAHASTWCNPGIPEVRKSIEKWKQEWYQHNLKEYQKWKGLHSVQTAPVEGLKIIPWR